MKTRYTVALSMVAGAAIGAFAVQGLNAQGKAQVYLINEIDVPAPPAPDDPPWIHELQRSVAACQGQFGLQGRPERPNPAASSVEFKIKTASINTGVTDRDQHLRTPDFFVQVFRSRLVRLGALTSLTSCSQ